MCFPGAICARRGNESIMLDLGLLHRELSQSWPQVYRSYEDEARMAAACFQRFHQDPHLRSAVIDKIRLATIIRPFNFNVIPVKAAAYSVIGVDGSQIYPDRHEGWAVGLLRASLVMLKYGDIGICTIHAEQQLLPPIDKAGVSSFVDAQRQLLELKAVAAYTIDHKVDVIFFDGSLIYWQLDSFNEEVQQEFLGSYLAVCYDLYSSGRAYCAFTSLPNSKDILDLIGAILSHEGNEVQHVDQLRDKDVLQYVLQPGQFTELFELRTQQLFMYPVQLRPFVTYYHTGSEIVRIEIPRWIVEQNDLCARVLGYVQDQCRKGADYPIVLSEAHAAAVISAADRQLFYHVLAQYAHVNQEKSPVISQKLYSKKILRS